MNGQRVKLLRRRFIVLYGGIKGDNIRLYRRFKKIFNKKIKVNTITKEMFVERILQGVYK